MSSRPSLKLLDLWLWWWVSPQSSPVDLYPLSRPFLFFKLPYGDPEKLINHSYIGANKWLDMRFVFPPLFGWQLLDRLEGYKEREVDRLSFPFSLNNIDTFQATLSYLPAAMLSPMCWTAGRTIYLERSGSGRNRLTGRKHNYLTDLQSYVPHSVQTRICILILGNFSYTQDPLRG